MPRSKSVQKTARQNPVMPLSSPGSVMMRKKRRPLTALTALAALMALPRPVVAGPDGGSVVAGQVAISQAGSVTTINQSTPKAIINWQGFSIGAHETVNFNQPSSSAATLNRVIGNEASVIAGALNANGQVFLVNSAGVLFTQGAQVNVGGLVASTLDIANTDFMAGKYTFSGTSSASVINQGKIHAHEGGYVALLGKTVSNEGVISAKLGTVAMASGEKITLNFNGDSLIDVTIDKGTLNALVENKHAIKADGGRVILTAKAADAVLSAQVNNSGIIQARTISDLKGGHTSSGSTGGSVHVGTIKLLAQGGTVKVAGKLDASAPKQGKGGFIETSGDKVQVATGTIVTTKAASGENGTWLIDPTDFTIGLGDAAQTASGIGVTTLLANLANGDISIATVATGPDQGDININAPLTWSTNSLTLTAANNVNVNAPVSWSSGTLTLNAGANIFINNVMTATGTANFIGNYGTGYNADHSPMGLYTYQSPVIHDSNNNPVETFDGRLDFSSTGAVTLNGQAYNVINSVTDLVAVRNNLAGNYVLGSNITTLTADLWTNAIGDTAPFSGNFNGLGHVITSLPTTATGLFGTIGSTGVVSNLGITGATVGPAPNINTPAVGILANVNKGIVVNSFAAGTLITGDTNTQKAFVQYAGGLVGDNFGLIAQSYSLANVAVTGVGGGLVGINETTGYIVDSSAHGGNNYAYPQTISSANASITSITFVGGLAGINAGTIKRSYANNLIQMTDLNSKAGSFVGQNTSTGTIDESYASRKDYSAFNYGPYLAGFVWDNSGSITNAYTASLSTYNSSNALNNWSTGFVYTNSGKIDSAYAYVSPSSSSLTYYGFAHDNTGNGTITNAYWSETNTISAIGISNATQLSSTDAAKLTSYTGFDTTIWGSSDSGLPLLKNMLIYLSNIGNTPNYGDAMTFGDLNATALGLQGPPTAPDYPYVLQSTLGADYIDAGTYTASSLVLPTNYANITGVLTVNARPLTIVGLSAADKTYDGTTSVTVSGNPFIIGYVGNQTINFGAATFTDKNVGSNKTIQLILTDGVNGGKASNYYIRNALTASITPKQITASISADNRPYNGTTADTVSYTLNGVLIGDQASLAYTAAFADPNAGQGKTVTLSGLRLTGADSGNYTLINAPATALATITPLAVNLFGSKPADGSASIAASNLSITNVVAGDTVTLSGSAGLGSTGSGNLTISDFSTLTLNNPNYTLAGATGTVLVGTQSLIVANYDPNAVKITSSGTATIITQMTDRAIIDWARFSVAYGESLTFYQPTTTSIILNRVIGNEKSVIDGALSANGRVFILNSNGILFSASSQVNVGALVATTLNLTDDDFSKGNFAFTNGGGNGSVVSAGYIAVSNGGFVGLASNGGVTQSGSLVAHGGDALLATANNLTLALDPLGIGIKTYTIGGLTGTTTVGGLLDVSSADGNGGLVEMAGSTVVPISLALNIGSNGTWSWTQDGSISVGSGNVFTSQIVQMYANTGNLILNSREGDISINDALTWAADTKLTLMAGANIDIYKPIIATGTNGGLVLGYGGFATTGSATAGSYYAIDTANGASVTLSGRNASLDINGQSYTLIHSMSDLANISPALLDLNGQPRKDSSGNVVYASGSGYYALAEYLDARGLFYSTAVVNNLHDGVLAGLGHVVDHLTINDPNSSGLSIGLVGTLGSNINNMATIRDIGLTNINVTSNDQYNGGLVGHNYGIIENTYVIIGSLSGAGYMNGGLVGFNDYGTIVSSYTNVTINAGGTGSTGGLVGWNFNGTIGNSHASGDVTGASNVGGLVGSNSGHIDPNVEDLSPYGAIIDSYATGRVTATGGNVGGLVGLNFGGNIRRSHATGDVYASGSNVGGLVGSNSVDANALAYYAKWNGNIIDSYATGHVTGYSRVGGLVGDDNGGNITNSYATGDVIAHDGAGPLVGLPESYYSVTPQIDKNSHGTGIVTNVDTLPPPPPPRNTGDNGNPSDNNGSSTNTGNTSSNNNNTSTNTNNQTSGNSNSSSTNTNGNTSSNTGNQSGSGASSAGVTAAQQAAIQALIQNALNAATVSATSNTALSAETPPSQSMATAGSRSTTFASAPKINENIAIEAPAAPAPVKPLPERKKTASNGNARHNGHAGGSYGASIHSIEVDGVRYDLENKKQPEPVH